MCGNIKSHSKRANCVFRGLAIQEFRRYKGWTEAGVNTSTAATYRPTHSVKHTEDGSVTMALTTPNYPHIKLTKN